MENFDCKVLWIDDEPNILEGYEYVIKEAGYTPLLAVSPEQGIELFKEEVHDIVFVLCDFRMPKMSGFDVRQAIMSYDDSIPFGIVSSFVTKEMALEALSLKVCGFYDKPIDIQQIVELIKKESAPRKQFIKENRIIESVFVEESHAILDEIEPLLLSLNYDRGNSDILKSIARGAHTLKGSSGCLSSNIITKYVHKYEDLVSGLIKKELILTDEVYETLFKGLDRIKELVSSVVTKKLRNYKIDDIIKEVTLDFSKYQFEEKIKAIENLKEPIKEAALGQAPVQKQKESISVPIFMLDELSTFSGEITVIRNMVNKIIRSLENKYIDNKEIQGLSELFDEMHKINGTIQNRITDLCKVPLSGVFKPIPRILRDLARDLGKSIQLEIHGENIRVDNSLVLVCSNSLIHLIRNSADHGIEIPDERIKIGKPSMGTVQIFCTENNNELQIIIKDDGKGIDPNKVKNKALEKELYSFDELNLMTEQQIFEIIFSSGFSTASKITDVSGRGVGMDMVKTSVKSVGGSIQIDSILGKGTTFIMRLPKPKSVLIINSLLIKCGDQCFAIPQDSILHVIHIEKEQYHNLVQKIADGFVIRADNTLYPLVNLQKVLSISGFSKESKLEKYAEIMEILIVQSENFMYALQVDEILDSEEIVLKSINSCFNYKGIYAGATFMGDGSIGLILDIKNIAELSGIKSLSSYQKNLNTEKVFSKILKTSEEISTTQNYLLFHAESKSIFGIPLDQVFRLEEIPKKQIQMSGCEEVVIYRDAIMPIYVVDKILNLKYNKTELKTQKDVISVIVTRNENGYKGLVVSEVLDIALGDKEYSKEIVDREGISGNTFILDKNVTILDMKKIFNSKQNVDII
ncbi:chemotaxis protein CheW [Silvanigrella aquatica]|uniref:histidine kinase n=1 Tax=Silvanigrella aquatica TaxID=1915309 RepID=A0A1L4CYX3_9BACT|nr:chemotaxis protein CheW [Silvanigrella aquatica]APJ03137.1 hypothetical protein AXG55_04140 [Silvanigrella aquatica]